MEIALFPCGEEDRTCYGLPDKSEGGEVGGKLVCDCIGVYVPCGSIAKSLDFFCRAHLRGSEWERKRLDKFRFLLILSAH